MPIIIHADDLGLTPSITTHILQAHDQGALNRASLIVNSPWFSQAVQAVLARPNLRTVLHLNLFEGKPLASLEKTTPLLNHAGEFHLGFVGLWRTYLQASHRNRQALAYAVECEFEAQIQCYQEAFPDKTFLDVDSHVHFHMIPFVFARLLALATRYPIRHIRTAQEPFFLAKKGGWTPLGPNLLKHLLLNHLTRRHKPKLQQAGITTNDTLLGVLYTGHMTLETVAAGLKRVTNNPNQEVEILFHPGFSSPTEAHIWSGRQDLLAFYASPWRQRELEVVQNCALADLIALYRNPSSSNNQITPTQAFTP